MELKKEQLEAINHNEGNVLISASAGSGKTFVMIQRLIRLIIEKRATVKEILAVTFTEAAAHEMKEKLKKELARQIELGQEGLYTELSDVATADICTLHSFCARLLRKYFFIANISPDFAVADQTVSDALKSQAVDLTFKKYYQAKDKWFLTAVERHRVGRRDLEFKKAIISMSEYLKSEAHPEKFIENTIALYKKENFENVALDYKNIINQTLDSLINCLEEALGALSSVEKAKTFTEELLSDVRLAKDNDLYYFKELDGYKKDLFRNKIPKELESAKALAVFARDAFVSLIKRVNLHLNDKKLDEENFSYLLEDAENIFGVLKEYEKNYAKLKAEENLLDFNDLERYTLKLLEDSEVCAEIKSAYKYVFIDEYQDTNDVQEEIMTKITLDNLFMVGDVKQSIYGFRGCKPEIFSEKFERMERANEKVIRLNCNFRSAKAVIDMVNAIFSYSMTKEFYGNDYAVSSMLTAGGIYPEDKNGRAEMHVLLGKTERSSESEKPRIYDLKEELNKLEKDDVSAVSLLVGEIIKKELGKTYFDVSSGEEKVVNYSDIAILTRNRNTEYVSALVSGLIRQGLPVASEVSHSVLDYPEVQLLINAVKLLDCFYQDIPLVSVMKSPIGNFTEEELARIVLFFAESGKRQKFFHEAFSYYLENADGELFEKVKNFYEYISEIRFLADFIGAKGALEQIILDSDYENCILASGLGENKLKRVRKFLCEAENQGNSYTVKEFLNKITLSSKAFELSMTAEENTIKITTIHSSKGLEYPVVIVCGLENKSRGEETKGIFLKDRKYGFAFKCYDDENRTAYETLVRGMIVERNAISTMKEELRLFYVATTRAKYSLHLTYKCSKDYRRDRFVGAERFINYIPISIPATTWDLEELAFSALRPEKRTVLIGKADEEKVSEMLNNFAFSYAHGEDTTLPLKTSVTEINTASEGKFVPAMPFVQTNESTDDKKGTLAHKVLELFDFNSNMDFSAQVNEMISSNMLKAEELKEISLEKIEKAISGGLLKEIKGKEIYKEQPFILSAPANTILDKNTAEEVLVQGIIDLLVIDKDTAKVIDYKYSKHGADTLKTRYEKQLNLYARAVSQILGKKVTDKIIINLLSGERVYID